MDWRNKEWYDLIQRFANAQNLMGWQKTIRIKQRLFEDRPKLNHLLVAQLRQLLNELEKVWHDSQKETKDDPKAE
jgi:Zn-dependent M32 family carboxypeptidase